MSLESGSFVSDLVVTNPPGTDKKKQGDDHLRLIKTVLRGTFPDASKTFYFPGGSTKTANYTVLATDQNKIIVGDATAGSITFTLPTLAAGDAGWMVTAVKSDVSANTVTIAGTINGAANVIMGTQFRSGVFIWSGTAWFGALSVSFQATVTTALLADLAVTTAKLVDLNVTTAKINDLGVTSGKLADNSVTSAKILDANVTNAKLAGPRFTSQTFLSGAAATYTTPAGCKSIRVRFCGGGGGGGAAATNAGAAGNTTTFGTSTALGGSGGVAASSAVADGGNGGVTTTGTLIYRQSGGKGGGAFNTGAAGIGGNGGSNLFGAAGLGNESSADGEPGRANTGAGGAGGSNGTTGGSGGGAGEYVELYINSPAATYTYTVGTGGAGGAAGSRAGGNGAAGVIIVEEYY